MAEALLVAEELKEIKRKIAAEQPEIPDGKRPMGEAQFQASHDTKKIPLDASQLDGKFLTIGGGLSQK